jgi:hypothetical protein
MTIEITAAHNEARLSATKTYIDTGAGKGKIQLWDTPRPVLGASGGAAPCAVVTLAKPCGTVASGKLTLAQDAPGGDLIALDSGPGGIVWARLLNGNGDVVADGDVTDSGGNGDFKLAGTAGTLIYAGGYVLLGTTQLG